MMRRPDPNRERDTKIWLLTGAGMMILFGIVIVIRLINGLPL